MADPKDLLDKPLTETERMVVEVHDRLQALIGRPDLAPCVRSNACFALAATWQICNDLGLRFDQPDEI